MTAAERLAIYRDGYRARLVECLADDYPAVRHLLGAEAFEAIAHAYVDKHPSRSPNLNAFGRLMPAFLAAHATHARDAMWPASNGPSSRRFTRLPVRPSRSIASST